MNNPHIKTTNFHIKFIVVLVCMLIPLGLFMTQKTSITEGNTSNMNEEEQLQIQQNTGATISSKNQLQIESALNLESLPSHFISKSSLNNELNKSNHIIIPFSTGLLRPVEEVELKISLPSSIRISSRCITNELIYARNCYFTENDPQVDLNKNYFIEYGEPTSDLSKIIENRHKSEIVITSKIFEMKENLSQAYVTCEIYLCDPENCDECTCKHGEINRNEFVALKINNFASHVLLDT